MAIVIQGTLKDGVDQLVEFANTIARTAQANAQQGVPGAKEVAERIEGAIPAISAAREPATKVERYFDGKKL